MSSTMTVTKVREAIKKAEHIFIVFDLIPDETTSHNLKIGYQTAAQLFARWAGDTQVLASYDTDIADCKMLFIGSLRGTGR